MIVFVPIKEESQRVPNKNFRMFDGEPLYKRCLLNLKDFTVVVDTDSEKILANIAEDPRLSHVTGFLRPVDLRGHEVPVNEIMQGFFSSRPGFYNEDVCQVHVTSPFLSITSLKGAQKFLETGKHDSVVSCFYKQTRLWRKEKYGSCPINHNPLRLEQTQDLPVYFEENSLFYMFRCADFLRTGSRIGQNPFWFATGPIESLDIDTEADWNHCVDILEFLKLKETRDV